MLGDTQKQLLDNTRQLFNEYMEDGKEKWEEKVTKLCFVHACLIAGHSYASGEANRKRTLELINHITDLSKELITAYYNRDKH